MKKNNGALICLSILVFLIPIGFLMGYSKGVQDTTQKHWENLQKVTEVLTLHGDEFFMSVCNTTEMKGQICPKTTFTDPVLEPISWPASNFTIGMGNVFVACLDNETAQEIPCKCKNTNCMLYCFKCVKKVG